MSELRRTAIAKAVAALITDTGYFARVVRCHPAPWELDPKPAAAVYARRERTAAGSADRSRRHLEIAVLVIVSAGEGVLDDLLQEATAQVEAALEANPHLAGTVDQAVIREIDFSAAAEPARPTAAARLTVDAIYQRPRADPAGA